MGSSGEASARDADDGGDEGVVEVYNGLVLIFVPKAVLELSTDEKAEPRSVTFYLGGTRVVIGVVLWLW